MSLLQEVRRLHKAGYDLIPLKGKRPIKSNWTELPRQSLDELHASIKGTSNNIGVRLGRPLPDGRFLACIDVDVVGELEPQEEEELDAVLASLLDSSSPPIAMTGFGNKSRHIYVATEQPAKTRKLAQSTRKVSYTKAGKKKQGPLWTVELRGYGAQTVLPPSVHPDTRAFYKWKLGGKLNGAGSLPLLACSPATQSPQTKPARKASPSIGELKIPSLYLHMLETGEYADYASRSEALYAVLVVLVRDTDLSDREIEELVLSKPLGEKARERPTNWVVKQCEKLRAERPDLIQQMLNHKPNTPFSEIKPLFEQLAKAGLGPIEREVVLNHAKKITGISKQALTTEFDSAKGDLTQQRLRLAHQDPVYEEVLNRHALVSWAGKPAVFRERKEAPAWESRYDIMTVGSLATFYENKPVLVGKKAINPVEVWRADPARKEFLEGARLVPPDETCPDGVFNLWQGFAVEPKRGRIEPWSSFVLNVICGGHGVYADWVDDWVADMFQHVGDPKGVALVLRGNEGIGKGTFANTLGHLFGSHYRHVTQESQLMGRFNGHFADSTLIFADEMVWGGDKKHRGTLYGMVTERHLMVERKNFDAVPMRNLNRMIIASNNDWIVPTGLDGRRWFVLDVSNQKKGDTRYFQKIRSWLREEGGYEALLYHYLHRDIAADLRRAPITKALIDQKIQGFDSVSAWWYEVLERGSIRPPVGELASEWEARVSKELVRSSYQSFCRDYGAKPQYEALVMKRIYELSGCRAVRGRDGEHRVHVFDFPPLEELRERMYSLLGHRDKEE